MLDEIIDFLIEIPVICKMGLIYGFAMLFLPIAQWISYRRDCKKYGKKEADEIARRYR
jgi:hypothetical protein